jgi:hypothetical protein
MILISVPFLISLRSHSLVVPCFLNYDAPLFFWILFFSIDLFPSATPSALGVVPVTQFWWGGFKVAPLKQKVPKGPKKHIWYTLGLGLGLRQFIASPPWALYNGQKPSLSCMNTDSIGPGWLTLCCVNLPKSEVFTHPQAHHNSDHFAFTNIQGQYTR